MVKVTLDKEVLKNKIAEYLSTDEGTFKARLQTLQNDVTFSAVMALAFDGAAVLEKYVKELGVLTGSKEASEIKRQALVEFIDDAIVIEGWFGLLEKFDNKVIEMIVDSVISLYNNKVGHDWEPKAIHFLAD